ncbi:MAG TPA: KTSC domain-containing protein [Blastocatellia bacterium]
MSSSSLQWIFVRSTNIAAIAYDEPEAALYVKFQGDEVQSDEVYRVTDVCQEVWDAFCFAPSKGKFFYAHIQNAGIYQIEKMPKDSAKIAGVYENGPYLPVGEAFALRRRQASDGAVFEGTPAPAPTQAEQWEPQPDPEFDKQTALALLSDELQEVAELRNVIADLDAEAAGLMARFLNSPIVQHLASATDKAKQSLIDTEGRLRARAEGLHTRTKEKMFCNGLVKIREDRRVEYDSQQALNYARQNLPALVELKKGKFEQHCRAVEATSPLPFVTITKTPVTTVASNLDVVLDKGSICDGCRHRRLTTQSYDGQNLCRSCVASALEELSETVPEGQGEKIA